MKNLIISAAVGAAMIFNTFPVLADAGTMTLSGLDADVVQSGTTVTGSITAQVENSGEAADAEFIYALYDKDGILFACGSAAKEAAAGESSVTIDVDKTDCAGELDTVKLFVWNSLDKMISSAAAAAESGLAGMARVDIIHTNDIHGYYKSTSRGQIGFAALKTLIGEKDADLVLDIGDTFHGQSFATVEEGMSIAELMKSVGYDAMTPGNHDWSYGAERLKELESAGGFKMLASNVDTADGADYFDTPYLVKDVTADNGTELRVGVVGVIDDSFQSSTVSDNIAGLTFAEESAEASKTAETLRSDEDCDIVIAITHNRDCEEFVSGISGIDAVLAGHEHKIIDETYTDKDGKSVPVYEAGYYFNDIGCLTITYDTESQTVVKTSDRIYTSADTAELAEDETVNAKISEIEAREAETLNRVIGTSDTEYPYSWEDIRIGEEEIGRIVTAAYLDAAGADIAFENAGGIRGGIPKGDITYGNLIAISPYGNTLLVKELTGAQILDLLESSIDIGIACDTVYTTQKEALANGEDPYQYSWPTNSGSYLQFGGIKAEYDTSRPKGERVLSAEINGAPVDADKTYTAATNNYVAEYDQLAEQPLVKDYGTCEEAIKAYIQKGGFKAAAETPNLTDVTGTELDDAA